MLLRTRPHASENERTSSMPLYLSMTAVSLMSISLGLLISEWHLSRGLWTAPADWGQRLRSGTYLFCLTSLLLLAHWALALLSARIMAAPIEVGTLPSSRAATDVPVGPKEVRTGRKTATTTRF